MGKKIKEKTISLYQTGGICPFLEWLESLDKPIQHRVDERLTRLLLGNLGDYKKISKQLGELRLHFGPGYRVYFSEIGSEIILLLAGGDKKSQRKDIKLAENFLVDYLEEKNEKKY